MNRDLIVKVCGMRDADNIRQVEPLVDWMGFIFAPRSPRFVADMPSYLPSKAKRVGVFVNDTEESIMKYIKEYCLDFIQLHGAESPEFCTRLKADGLHLVKAFPISSAEDLKATFLYENVCDYFLFDTKCPTDGGSGKLFDWSVLDTYKGSVPFLLSGGLGEETAENLRGFSHPRWCGIDLNSRFEIAPGRKDAGRIDNFLQSVFNK